jgi:hypothetical protein
VGRSADFPPEAYQISQTSDEIVPPPALIRAGLDALPSIIRALGERASRRFIEFFTANIRNRNTRMAYARAVKAVLRLERGSPARARRYRAGDGGGLYRTTWPLRFQRPTVKQHLAAIRRLFDYLVTGGILPSNPAGSVRGPTYVVTRGKTPVR